MEDWKKLRTGIESLDNVIGGFHYGNLITLAGRPCMRTEYFTYSMLRNWLSDETVDEDIVFFSLRTREELVTHRIGLQVVDVKESMKWTAEYHLRGLKLSILCDKIRS